MPSKIENAIVTFRVPRAANRYSLLNKTRLNDVEERWTQFRKTTKKLTNAEKRLLPMKEKIPISHDQTRAALLAERTEVLQLYRRDSNVTKEWLEILDPICAHKLAKLEKTVKDHRKMHPAQHAPPLTTIAVRWHNNGPDSNYTHKDLHDIFSRVGSVTSVTFQSQRSAHIVFGSIKCACHAVAFKNLGHASCPLHVQWLPGAVHNAKWNKKQSVAKPFMTYSLSTRYVVPPAITRSSQIFCRICETQIKKK